MRTASTRCPTSATGWLRPGARGSARIAWRTRASGPNSIVCGSVPAGDRLDAPEAGRPDQARGLERRGVLDVEAHAVTSLDRLHRRRLLAPCERRRDHVS